MGELTYHVVSQGLDPLEDLIKVFDSVDISFSPTSLNKSDIVFIFNVSDRFRKSVYPNKIIIWVVPGHLVELARHYCDKQRINGWLAYDRFSKNYHAGFALKYILQM